mgnify:CR=1 FL=1
MQAYALSILSSTLEHPKCLGLATEPYFTLQMSYNDLKPRTSKLFLLVHISQN